jgi:hypothetical protein
VKEFGQPTLPMKAEMCVEEFEKTKIKQVDCSGFIFKPDGSFMQSQTTVDLNPSPKDDYKDSLALTVGTCSTLAE